MSYKRLTTDEYVGEFMTDGYEICSRCNVSDDSTDEYVKIVSWTKKVPEVIARLMAYEDSGLSPYEVDKLVKAKAEGLLVEVVRCKDCIRFTKDKRDSYGCCNICRNEKKYVDEENFCSGGKLKGEEE